MHAVKRGKYTEKADVYSCCIVMWEMASGVKPFSTVPVQELNKPEVPPRGNPAFPQPITARLINSATLPGLF